MMTIGAIAQVQQAKAPQGAPVDTPPEASADPAASPIDSFVSLVTDPNVPVWQPVAAIVIAPFAYAAAALFGCGRTGFEIGEARPIDNGNNGGSGGAGMQSDAGLAGTGGTFAMGGMGGSGAVGGGRDSGQGSLGGAGGGSSIIDAGPDAFRDATPDATNPPSDATALPDANRDAQTGQDGGSTVSDAATPDGNVVIDAGPACTFTPVINVTDPAVLGGASVPDIILAGSVMTDGATKSRIGLSFTRNRDGGPNIDFKLITSDFVTPSLQEIELTPSEKISSTSLESSRSSLAWTGAPSNRFFVSYANRDTSVTPVVGTMEGAWIDSNGLKLSDAPVGSDPTSFVYSSAALATDAGVLVYWMDSMTPPVTRLHRTRFDTSGTRVLFNDPFTPNNASSLAAADSLSTGGAVLAWQDSRDGNLEVYSTVVDDTGVRIPATSNDIRLSNNSAVTTSPAVASAGAEAGIVYVDNRVTGGTQLFFSIVDNQGTVRVPEIQITESPAVAREPDIAWNGSEYLVVWQDQRTDNGVGNHEIYAQRLDADGNKIDQPIRITDHPARSDLPKVIAVDNDFVIVFEDTQPSGGATVKQIYLSKLSCR